jgi:hypothetical protein
MEEAGHRQGHIKNSSGQLWGWVRILRLNDIKVMDGGIKSDFK